MLSFKQFFRLIDFKVCAFVGEVTGLNERNQLASLAKKFNFSLSTALTDSAWNFVILPDTIATVSSALLVALARSASIVRLEYFMQLTTSNNFSEALMQPSCPAFPPKYLLPRPRRCEQISTALAGVRQLICLQQSDYGLLSPLQPYLNLAIVLGSAEECVNVPFCDLLVAGGGVRERIKVGQLARAIIAESFVEAFVQCNESLLFIENVYPLSNVSVLVEDEAVGDETIVEETGDEKDPLEREIETVPIAVNNEKPSPRQVKSISSLTPVATFSSSPVILQTIPSSLLRPQQPLSTSNATTTARIKFVKCHPLTRQPNSVPLLYGPHQLQSTAPTTSSAINQASNNVRKRVLIKDAWLAEGDSVQVEFNKNARTEAATVRRLGSTSGNTGTGLNSTLNANHTGAMTTAITPTIANNTADTTASPTIPTAAPKFQSSFFQNLQKKT